MSFWEPKLQYTNDWILTSNVIYLFCFPHTHTQRKWVFWLHKVNLPLFREEWNNTGSSYMCISVTSLGKIRVFYFYLILVHLSIYHLSIHWFISPSNIHLFIQHLSIHQSTHSFIHHPSVIQLIVIYPSLHPPSFHLYIHHHLSIIYPFIHLFNFHLSSILSSFLPSTHSLIHPTKPAFTNHKVLTYQVL